MAILFNIIIFESRKFRKNFSNSTFSIDIVIIDSSHYIWENDLLIKIFNFNDCLEI